MLIPVQIIGLVLLIVLAVLLAICEKRLIAKRGGFNKKLYEEANPLVEGAQDEASLKAASLRRPKLLWLNTLLALAFICVLVWGIVPAGFTFMIGVSVVLPLNYPNMKDQMERIKDHAPNALLMAAIILAAGSFLGILNGTLMLDSIATDLVTILPAFVIPYLHLIIGFFGVPFDLLLSTDAYYFALFPIVEQVAATAGVASLSTAYAMIIGNIIGTFVSPFSPALWLALGLAGLEMGRHIRYSLLIMWGFSIVLLVISIFMGVI